MLNWFWNWLDPKILKLEVWVNKTVIKPEYIDIDLDKVKKGEVRENGMFRKPPNSGEDGPFIMNLTGAKVVDLLYGPSPLEAFALMDHNGVLVWRHRDAGSTEDFNHRAFDDMQDFFRYVQGGDDSKYWQCVLKTKAIRDGV